MTVRVAVPENGKLKRGGLVPGTFEALSQRPAWPRGQRRRERLHVGGLGRAPPFPLPDSDHPTADRAALAGSAGPRRVTPISRSCCSIRPTRPAWKREWVLSGGTHVPLREIQRVLGAAKRKGRRVRSGDGRGLGRWGVACAHSRMARAAAFTLWLENGPKCPRQGSKKRGGCSFAC